MISQQIQQGKRKSDVKLAHHGIRPVVDGIWLPFVEFADKQVHDKEQVGNEYLVGAWHYADIAEAKEEENACQYADGLVHLHLSGGVYQSAEFVNGQCADNREQDSERYGTA